MWIKVTTTDGIKHLINACNIIEVFYREESDLTSIVFLRSAYQCLYVKGNIVKDLQKVLNINNAVHTLGE